MRLGVDPKVDYAFKRMCGTQETASILASLLESVIGFPVHDLKILNPFIEKETSADKLSVLDVKARDSKGRLYNVEVQLVVYRELIPRFVYYWARLHATQLRAGEDYDQLTPTISIFLVNGNILPGESDYHSPIGLQNLRTQTVFSKHLQIHLIEITKFHKQLSELETLLDKWIYFLKHAEDIDMSAWPEQLKLVPLTDAAKELLKLSYPDIERELYEGRLKAQRDELSFRRWSERQRTEGREEGRQEGLQEGRQEGLQEGLAEGRQQGIQEGRQQGVQEGREEVSAIYERKIQLMSEITALEQKRGATPTALTKLSKMSLNELEAMLAGLQ